MRFLAALIVLLPLALQARPPKPMLPAQPIHLESELDAALADLHTVQRQLRRLKGDFRTMKSLDSHLKAIENRLIRLRRSGSYIQPPNVVVTLPNPTPQIVVVQQPTPEPRVEPAPFEPAAPVAMDRRTFSRLLSTMKGESFADDKLNVLRTGTVDQWLSVRQVGELVDLFSFDKDKLAAVRLVRPQILDLENAFQLYDHFTFSGDKKKLRSILGR